MTIETRRGICLQRAVVLLLAAYVLLMLFAGLRPYSSYADRWVHFDPGGRHTVFEHYGLVTGDLDPELSVALVRHSFEVFLDVRLIDPPDGRFQVLAQIDSPDSDDPLIIGQWQSSVIVMSGRDYRSEHGLPRFSADLSPRLGAFVEIVLAFDPDGSRLTVDGDRLATGPVFPFERLPTRISIGNAPDGNHGWTGELRRLRLRGTLPESTVVHYDFATDPVPTIVDTETGLLPLHVPSPGRFPDGRGIGRMRLQDLLDGNLSDVVVNLAGFMPFGALLCVLSLAGDAGRAARRENAAASSRSRAAAIVLAITFVGFLVSLGIESLQTRIAGRSAHAHDLLLNTLGAGMGAFGAYLLWRALSLTFGRSPKIPPDHRES